MQSNKCNSSKGGIFLTAVTLLLGYWAPPVLAYNSESSDSAHHWITKKAVQHVKRLRPDLAAILPLDAYLPLLSEGVRYADHTEGLECRWTYPVDEYVANDCDTLHHYFKHDVIETELGVDVGHPGDITAPYYASVLYQQAIKFWRGGVRPSLSALPYKDAGYMTNATMGRDDLGKTYVGGLPFCGKIASQFCRQEAACSYSCPRWPSWVSGGPQSALPNENVENAIEYLGWAIHLVQDLTVYVHSANLATKDHREQENDMDDLISQGALNHLPVMPDIYRTTNWSVERYANEAAGSASEDNHEASIDAAIKLTAAVLIKYFDEAVGMIRNSSTIYVDSSFQEASDGSELSPFRSLSQALQAMGRGKRIAIAGVHPGDYVISSPCTLTSFFADRDAVIGE